MKVFSTVVLLFFLCFAKQHISAQTIYLKIGSAEVAENRVIDSLGYQTDFLDYKTLEEEIEGFHKKLQTIGFIENEILSTEKINDSTYYSNFRLNQRFYTIYIYYNKNDVSKSDFKGLINDAKDDHFKTSIYSVEELLGKLNRRIVSKGQPFASLKLVDLKKRDEGNLEARLEINYEKQRTIDEIVVKGYEKFPKAFLKHFLQIKKGRPFNLDRIKQRTEGFNTLPFANQTRSPEVLFTKDSTRLYLYIEKQKTNTFDGFLGFGTNEETNKIEFDGYLNLQLINNLNFGESFRLSYKSDEIDQKTFDVNLNLPYILGSALGAEFNLNIFKKDSTFTTVQQDADLFYQVTNTQRIYGGISGLQSNNLLTGDTSNDVKDYKSFFYKVKYQFFKPQSYSRLFPENFKVLMSLGIGNRTYENTSQDQQIYSLSTFKIFNLNDKNSIYIKAVSSGVFSDDYFNNELLRFGGINSIRGFEENSLTATLYGVVNSEYRYQLNPNIYIHSIVDASYLENKLNEKNEKLFGFGFGFGIITKAGLLRFNYANGKNENQKFSFSNSKIHLSLNAIF